MLIFVDYEHADRYTTKAGAKIQAARTWITYRLEDVSGMPCHLVRYDRVTEDLLDRLNAKAIFVSGNGSAPDLYGDEAGPLQAITRNRGLPMFGFCGGFQFIAQALGAELVPLDLPAETTETDLLKQSETGDFYEFGYHPITIEQDHLLLNGLGAAPVFRHAHGLHIPNPPAGFEIMASTEHTPVQLAVNEALKIVGTQFHPEYWTSEHPEGKRLIENFLHWAGI